MLLVGSLIIVQLIFLRPKNLKVVNGLALKVVCLVSHRFIQILGS